MLTTLDINDFNSCVQRGLYLLNNIKNHMNEDGLEFNTCIKSCKWAIEQKVLNRKEGSTMMSAIIDYVEMIQEREMQN